MAEKESKETKPIKDAVLYKAQLCSVILLDLAMFWIIYKTGLRFRGDALALIKDWQKVLLPGLGALLVLVANGFFDPLTKARMVFLRWNNPLPGSRAFSQYAHRDSRIDVDRLRKKIGNFPREPSKQNASWYRLYTTIRTEPAVVHIHREYLLARDITCLSVLMLLLMTPFAIAMFSSVKVVLVLGGILAAQYLFARMAAMNAGKRLVTTVLAIKAAET
jgi:hypothetical protein